MVIAKDDLHYMHGYSCQNSAMHNALGSNTSPHSGPRIKRKELDLKFFTDVKQEPGEDGEWS